MRVTAAVVALIAGMAVSLVFNWQRAKWNEQELSRPVALEAAPLPEHPMHPTWRK